MILKRLLRAPSAPPRAHAARRVLLLAVAILAGMSGAGLGQPPEDWAIERFQRESGLEPGWRVVVSDPAGDVRIRPGEPGRVELSAVAQRHTDDAFTPQVELRGSSGTLLVESAFVNDEGEPIAELPAEPRRRIDIVIFVPATTEVEILGDRDRVEVKGMEAPVVATTGTGDIVISTTGPVRAKTERGEISVTLSRLVWQGRSRLESLTGDIVVWLPPRPDLVVRGETFGEITTDFSLEIERRPPSAKKYFEVAAGDTGRELLVTSNRGRIKLLRSSS